MSASAEQHPFRTAWETRDAAAWGAELAEDVRLNSPIVEAPFVGREAVGELYEVLFEALGEVTFTAEATAADGATVFYWRTALGGRTIDGTDVVRRAEDGSIAEITVYIRPLVAIGAFAGAVGPRLARRHGPVRGALLRFLAAPLSLLLLLADRSATALIRQR
jgi:ketosteroid isomerase-like protein